jgi:hypothetical protein
VGRSSTRLGSRWGVIDGGISALGEANLWSLSERELLGLRIAQEATLARLHAQVLATTREVDARGAVTALPGALIAAMFGRSRQGRTGVRCRPWWSAATGRHVGGERRSLRGLS